MLGVVEREMLETVGIERGENVLEFKKEGGEEWKNTRRLLFAGDRVMVMLAVFN